MDALIRNIGVFVVLLSMTGCMSILARRRPDIDSAYPRYVYPGVQLDCVAMTSPFDPRAQTDALYAGFAYPLFFIGLLEFPFSVVLDTVCLPYDAYQVTFGGKLRSGEDESPTPNSSVRGIPRR
jgi:uncharacterized protein YceK